MARHSGQQSTRGRASQLPVLRWLQVGAVSAGLGVAVIAAPPLAAAQDSPASTTASETSTSSTDSTTPTTDTETTTDTDESASAQESTDTSDISDELTDQTEDTPAEAEPTPTDTEAPAEDPDTGESAAGSASTPRADNDPATPATAAGDPSPVADHSESTQPDAKVSPSPDDSPDANTADTDTADTSAVSLTTAAAVVTPVRAAAVSPPSYPASVLEPVTWRSVAVDVLSWTLGVTDPSLPFIPNSPAPDWLAGLWLGVRKMHYTLFNSAPTLSPGLPNTDPDTGIITGSLFAHDPDNDTVTYTLTTAPAEGSVVIAADGTWTYTPNPDCGCGSDTDTFTITATDNRPHPVTGPANALSRLFGRLLTGLGLDTSRLPTSTATINLAEIPVVCGSPGRGTAAACGDGGSTTPTVAFPRLDGKNDIDLKVGNQATVVITQQPEHGTLVPFANDKFVYIPDPNYTGVDLSSAVFNVTDNGATTTITVPMVAGPAWVQNLKTAPTHTQPVANIPLADWYTTDFYYDDYVGVGKDSLRSLDPWQVKPISGGAILRGTADSPFYAGSGIADDGVEGMIKNTSNKPILVQTAIHERRSTSRGTYELQKFNQAYLLPGDEMPYLQTAPAGLGNAEQIPDIRIFQVDPATGGVLGAPVRLKMFDPYSGDPETYFAPDWAGWKNIRTTWDEGTGVHEIWGATKIFLKYESKGGWDIPNSQAWRSFQRGLAAHETSDWQVFNIYVDSI
ncbi:MAG: Ig-like domain-containing protein [Mycolicibacterium sp.]|uniref:Ig-like domain-containing protein n=1 Tax=Mycolicibacterium sp. TaxID=2320850 RepID=UPI003D0D5754